MTNHVNDTIVESIEYNKATERMMALGGFGISTLQVKVV